MKVCEECGGSFKRYGLFNCNKGHKKPTLAETIVREIESDLNDRRGMGLDNIDDDVAWEIRQKWASIINKHLRKKKGKTQ